MYSKSHFYITIAFFCVVVFACKKESTFVNPTLVGTWSDGNVNYSFAQNLQFGIKYKRAGSPQDSVATDSIWGKYSLDSKRNNIYFEANQLTEKRNPAKIISKVTKLPVWNYSFVGDSVLHYTSNSLNGKLRKVKK